VRAFGGGVADHRRNQNLGRSGEAKVPATASGAPASESSKAGNIQAAISPSSWTSWGPDLASACKSGSSHLSRLSTESHIFRRPSGRIGTTPAP
jgi:hypothetical protein